MDAEGAWEPWDPKRSLFDNHVSASLEENLEYMWRHFRFTVPDAEFLVDPAGLLNYLVRTTCLQGRLLAVCSPEKGVIRILYRLCKLWQS